MKLEPRECRRESGAVHDAALVPRRRIRIAQVPLQHQDLPEELDVAARERQDAESGAELLRAAVMLIEEAERNQERAEEDRVAERLGIALERAPVIVDR